METKVVFRTDDQRSNTNQSSWYQREVGHGKRQEGTQTSKQARKQASTQASKEARNQAREQATKTASKQISK